MQEISYLKLYTLVDMDQLQFLSSNVGKRWIRILNFASSDLTQEETTDWEKKRWTYLKSISCHV